MNTEKSSWKVVCLTLVLGVFSSAVWAEVRCAVGGKSVSPYDASTTAGVTGMMRCKDERTGLPSSEQELRGGVFMGLSRSYDASGRLQRERMINERGNTEGFEREFWPNGKLRAESSQNNGNVRGAARTYFDSGKIERASFTLDGTVMTSLAWDRNGDLTSLMCSQATVLVEDTKPCGFEGRVQTTLFQNGKRRELRTMEQGKILAATTYRLPARDAEPQAGEQIASEAAFQNGQRWQRVFNPAGADHGKNVLREERLYEPGRNFQGNDYRVNSTDGLLQWSKAWGANEQLTEHIRYVNGRPQLTERWHPNSAMKERITVTSDGGGSRSVRESFDDGGQLTARQTTIAFGSNRDQLTGQQQSFHSNGKLAVEETYSKPDEYGRTRLVTRKQWDNNGKLQSDDDILEDGSRRRSAL
jgi:antitoxin component YwqK of YwqJK toxin-antitoxin module